MSRTTRKIDEWKHRRPHTFSEIKQLDGILYEDDLDEYPFSKINHIKAREHSLPTLWDDNVISAYYETYQR